MRQWDFSMDMQGGQPALCAGRASSCTSSRHGRRGVGHIAFGSAQQSNPLAEQAACASNAHRQPLPRVNEIVCFRLDGSLETLIVAPNLTDLNAPGGGTDDYSKLPKGNLDLTGEYFIWTANAGTGRLDAFVVRIPVAIAALASTSGQRVYESRFTAGYAMLFPGRLLAVGRETDECRRASPKEQAHCVWYADGLWDDAARDGKGDRQAPAA